MKSKQPDEFEKFNKVMDKLLSVTHSELQRKLEEEKLEKAERKKKPAISSPASRASAG